MILNMIKNLLRDWLNKDDKIAEDSPNTSQNSFSSTFSSNMKIQGSAIRNSSIDDYNHGQNFTIYPAIGGKVVQIHYYNPQTDRTSTNLYIITDDEDFGEQLAMIVTRNNLSR